MPYVFQALLGQRVTITYEDISPFIATASEDQAILKFPVMHLKYYARNEFPVQSKTD